MRILLFILSISLTVSALAQDLKTMTSTLAQSESMRAGRFSFYAKDLTTGTILVQEDIHRKVSPASTLKLLTSYAAIDVLGPDYRFETLVGYTGEIIDEGRLEGNIVIKASGDPALGAKDFLQQYGNGSPIERQVAKSVRDMGITSISGEIIIIEDIYTGTDIPDEWTWQDMGNYFAAAVHAFTFEENKFEIVFKSPSQAGKLTTVMGTSALLAGVTIDNHVQSADIRSDQAYVYAAPKSNRMEIHGRIPRGKSEFTIKGAIPNPAEEFIARLSKSLDQMGITLEGKDIKVSLDSAGEIAVSELLVLTSPRLETIIAYTNMHSNNLYAEHLLRHVGIAKGSDGSIQGGLKAIMSWCSSKGISTEGVHLFDGSGLSRADVVSTRFMLDVVSSLYKEPYYESLKAGLPVAGRSGSMRRLGKGSKIEGKMFAKTGYIEAARGYVGYFEKGESTIVFAILANDYEMSATAMRKEMEKLLVKLGE